MNFKIKMETLPQKTTFLCFAFYVSEKYFQTPK